MNIMQSLRMLLFVSLLAFIGGIVLGTYNSIQQQTSIGRVS